jgi:hypothetical protein
VKQTTHSDQMIIRYLLNDLPAEDEARFEEAYLRDGGLLERVQSLEEDLIEDYVKGDLSDYERQRFERHYLASTPRRARVETARQLVHLCSLPSTAHVAAPDAIGSRLFSLHAHLRRLMRQPLALGFGVATALLLVLGSVLIIEVLRLRGRVTAISEERAALVERTGEAERQLADERGRLSEERTQITVLRERLGDVVSQLDRLKQESAQTSKDQIVYLALEPGSRDLKNPDSAVIFPYTNFVVLRVDIERQETRNPRPYRAILKTVEGGKEIWTQEVKPRQSRAIQYVVVRVPADRFRSSGEQDFMLTLSARAEGNDYEEFENCYFQVTSR